jgi:hypothetical protein
MDPSDTATARREQVILLSHAEEDRVWAEEIMNVVESRGARCWAWWRDSRPGELWEEQIVDAIDGASTVVLLMSPAAARSDEVYRELSLAARRDKRLLAFVADSFDPSWLSRRMEYRLSGVHVSRWSAGSVDTILQTEAGDDVTRGAVSAVAPRDVLDRTPKRHRDREAVRAVVVIADVVRLAVALFLAMHVVLARLGVFAHLRRRRDRRSTSRVIGDVLRGIRHPRARRRARSPKMPRTAASGPR